MSLLNNYDSSYFSLFPIKKTINSYYSYIKSGVKYIFTDTRRYFNKISKTFFGDKQTNWIISQINESKNNTNIKGIVIVITQPYYYNSTVYESDIVKQSFVGMENTFDYEKTKIGKAISELNFKNSKEDNFKSVLMISNGRFLSFDNGGNNPYGGFPIASCGPLSGSNQCLGGPFSHGYAIETNDNYCVLKTYSKDDNVCFLLRGVISQKESKPETNVFYYDTCDTQKYNANFNLKCPILWKEKIFHTFILIGITIFIFVFFYVFLYRLAVKSLEYSVIDKRE